jgi:uncharacterized membrane protein YeaQ/YmgE (transglycosylase-associated protein family)
VILEPNARFDGGRPGNIAWARGAIRRSGLFCEQKEELMGILGWIILGLLAGAIAKAILPGDDPGGIIVTTIIGIVGAIVGGLIASAVGIGDIDEFFDLGTWLLAIGGSLLVLLAYRAFVGGRRDTAVRY